MKASIDVHVMKRDEMEAYAKNPNNRLIVAIPVLLVASFLFYVLTVFFQYLGGSDSSASGI